MKALDQIKIRLLHKLHPQYTGLAFMPFADTVRREICRATQDQHEHHENLTADMMRDRTKAQRAKL